jgi:hypothetical protein
MLSKQQRKALFDLCTIFHLTFYEEPMRAAAQNLRELLRKNTLDPKHNKCDFDMTPTDRVREQAKKTSPKKKNANP